MNELVPMAMGLARSLELAVTDLQKSALTPQDMSIRQLSLIERSAIDVHQNIPGYVIPYFDIDGLPVPFYRVRLFDAAMKYKQPKGSQNHVYYPKDFGAALNGHPYVIITEGEKKGATATKFGFPTVALGGVYSWRNAVAKIPSEQIVSKLDTKPGAVDLSVGSARNFAIKLDDNLDVDSLFNQYATGFDDLVELIKDKQLTVFICFDTAKETRRATKSIRDVQRAASKLAIELRKLGIPLMKIKQLILPNHRDEEKVGLDDFLAQTGTEPFTKLVEAGLSQRVQFPKHPNINEYVQKKLQNPKSGRRDTILLSHTIIADLDGNGVRLSSANGNMHYFNRETKNLMRITSGAHANGHPVICDRFQNLLYHRYGLTGMDQKINRALVSGLSAEEPIDQVIPRRGTFSIGDTIYHQVSNSTYAAISADSINLHDNGTGSIMFEEVAAETEELDQEALARAIKRAQVSDGLHPYWFDVLQTTRLKDPTSDKRITKLVTLLFYLSPWLARWRGSQLPVELITGEGGSGKSTLYSLRLRILSGREDLRNKPTTIRDWHASVLTTGGLHVIDNANLESDPSLGQAISDEMCRIITEPKPTVEMRKFYTEHDLVRVPVNVTFAMTSLRLPFRQLDLMQRALHLHLDKGTDVMFDSFWAEEQLRRYGGRLGWTAHHLAVLQKFLSLVKDKWQPAYRAKYRLINFEQAAILMAEVFGWNDVRDWLPTHLSAAIQEASTEVDWILRGLVAFREFVNESTNNHSKGVQFHSTDVANWAEGHDEFSACKPLCQSRRVASYITEHKSLVHATVGIEEHGVTNGKITYVFI